MENKFMRVEEVAEVLEVSTSFSQLGRIAEKYRCAIILVGHLNKAQGNKSNYRGLGSIDFQATARSVLVVGRVKDKPEVRVAAHQKSSLAPEGKQHFTDERTGIRYTLQGDYYLPDLQLPPEKETEIGLWGQRHLRYLKQNRKVLYTNLLTTGKLNDHLTEIDKQAEDMFFRLVKQMAEREGVTEKLKADNQMEWVGRMNNIRSRATEIVNAELIFA